MRPILMRTALVRTALALVLPAALLAASCSDDTEATDDDPTVGSLPAAVDDGTSSSAAGSDDAGEDGTDGTAAVLELRRIDVDVEAPMDAVAAGTSLLVAERAGRVVELVADGGGGWEVAGVVVDLVAEVGDTGSEKGLLGVEVDLGVEMDTDGGRLWVNHTRAEDGATRVARYDLTGRPGALSATNPRTLLVIDQPFPNHNGGDVELGPDGHLWVATGDGGAAGDPDGRAQRLSSPLGKLLRIDADTGEAPEGNPYVGRGDADRRVWARGLRNPWRISFDPATDDLWIADVGQNEVEEIDRLTASSDYAIGGDLGWDRLEGDREYPDAGPTRGWPQDDAPLVDPVHTYTHDDGRCSITGGFVVRADALSALDGWYLYSDFCDGVIRALSPQGEAADLGLAGSGVVSINPDPQGMPLVLDSEGIARIQAQ